jgi:hypothetical protein
MIVADSIGFSATHTITSILSEVPDAEVSHGSRNFEVKGPIGHADQTPEAFADQMVAKAEEGKSCFAVHTNFDPLQFKPACEERGITYKVITREPRKHFRSCYSWLVTKILQGDTPSYDMMVHMNQLARPALGGYANFHTGCYAFAMSHVSGFLLNAVKAGAEMVKMEDLVSDEGVFKDCFDLPEQLELSHFQGEETHQASHVGKLDVPQIRDQEIEALHKVLTFNLDGRAMNFQEYCRVLGY